MGAGTFQGGHGGEHGGSCGQGEDGGHWGLSAWVQGGGSVGQQVVLPQPDLITNHKSWSGHSVTSEVTTWSQLGSGYDYNLGKSC